MTTLHPRPGWPVHGPIRYPRTRRRTVSGGRVTVTGPDVAPSGTLVTGHRGDPGRLVVEPGMCQRRKARVVNPTIQPTNRP